MKKPLAALLVIAALFVAWRTFAAAPAPAWVNLFAECPNNADYGTRIADSAPLYADTERLEAVGNLPHGAPVEILRREGDMVQTRAGWLPASLVSDYNPADGVQPDFSACG